MSIASRIQARLQALGLSERAASVAAGLSPSAVNKILTEVSESPRVATLEALAPVLQCSVVYLVTGRADQRCGSSIRDAFAIGALQGVLASEGQSLTPPDKAAKRSYEIADAMLAERSKAVRP